MKYWHDQMKEHYYETNFGYVKDIRHLGEKIDTLVSRGCHSWQKSTKLNFNFTNFAPCSLILYKSTLTPSSFFRDLPQV